MSEILAPLTPEYLIQIPQAPAALIGWVLGLIGIFFLSIYLYDHAFKFDRPSLLWLAILSVSILILTPFMGILPALDHLLPIDAAPFRHLMFFAAVPMMVACGVLGIFPGIMLGGLSGLLLAYLDTHNIFTPLIMMNIALFFCWSVRQRYRTVFFQWLRFPVIAAMTSLFISFPLVFFALILSGTGRMSARVATALSNFPMMVFVLGGMVLVGGVVCVIVQAFAQKYWGSHAELQPSPGERSYRYRLISYGVPILGGTLAVIFISTWVATQINARRMMVRQLSAFTNIAAESLGLFIETGELTIQEIASGYQGNLTTDFDQDLITDVYFDELAVFDLRGELIAGDPLSLVLIPPSNIEGEDLTEDVFRDDKTLFLTAAIQNSERAEWAVFITGIRDMFGEPKQLLWGWTLIEDNPFAQPLLKTMVELKQQGGYGQVVSDSGAILFGLDRKAPNDEFASLFDSTATYFQSTTLDGKTLAHFYQPVNGRRLGIVATLPGSALDEIAWQTIYPILLISSAALILILGAIWVGLSPVQKDMETMTAAIEALAAGEFILDRYKRRVNDNRGYFSTAFEHMVIRQQRRMEKQTNLLSVSGRVAGQLNLKESLHIILSAALTHGACSARFLLTEFGLAFEADELDHRFGLGKHTQLMAVLDETVLERSSVKAEILLKGSEISQNLPPGNQIFDDFCVISVPINWNDLWFGVLWVAFENNQLIDDEDVAYIKDLGHFASAAIMNSKTFEESKLSQTLLKSVVNLLPDAVIISDQDGHIIFQNNHAAKLLGFHDTLMEGGSLSTSLVGVDFKNGWQLGKKPEIREVHLHDGKAFQLITSPIRLNKRQDGQAMIFRDLTQQKIEDLLKTEFVTTVSHELRSPLTLILGYAKILRLTGNLNEQQDAYISNIIDGVEEMKNLVQKLLDIGRLEGGDPLDIQQFTAEEIIEHVVESMDAQAKQKNIQILVNLPDSPLLIEADQTFLTQALKNLFENAVKFSKMGGDIALRVRRNDDRVVFAVQDQGIGIAPLDQRHLFKKFQRISTQGGLTQTGSGLGLAIVKSIAERHGGQVWLESQLGKGSTFYLEIPRKQS